MKFLDWLFPKCWFCKTESVPLLGGHKVHIKHSHGIEKVKICTKCLIPLYRHGGVHVKKSV